MAINDLSFEDISTVLTSIVKQATGETAITPTNTADFIAVGTTALKTGHDPLATAISQVVDRTIFSTRPYSAKFKGLEMTDRQWGNHVRKLNMVDKPFEVDQRFELTDGDPIDMYAVNKPEVLQTNFYGNIVYSKSLTVYRDQLDNAFTGPDQFAEFLSMYMGNASDMLEQARESLARATIANMIGGKIKGDVGNVIHLVTEYNDYAGTQLDSSTVRKPENFPAFARWMFGRIMTLSQLMTERSTMYHINVTGKEVARHTPVEMQRLYLLNTELNQISTEVLSNTFNDRYLQLMDYERVGFWQSIDTPYGISVTPSYLGTDGNIVTAEENLEQSNVLGILCDVEAMGVNFTNQWSGNTPMNVRGGYYNVFFHETQRWWNDFTENAVVLLLD